MLVVIGEVDIGTITATITPINQVTMVYCCVYLLLLVMLMIFFMKIKEVVVGVMVKEVELGLNHYSIYTYVEGVDGDGRSRYRSQTSPSIYHYSGELGRSFFIFYGHDKRGHKSQTSQFPSYQHGRLYIAHPRSLKKLLQRV